ITARLNAAAFPPARHWQPCLTKFVELCATKCGATSATRAGQSRSKRNTGLEAAGGKALPPCALWGISGHGVVTLRCPRYPRKRTSELARFTSGVERRQLSDVRRDPTRLAASTYRIRLATGSSSSNRIASSSPEQHDALRINTNEYLLPSRQWVKRRAASDKLLTAPKEMHLGEVALKDRLVDARGPDVTLADGPQRRNLQVNRTY